MTRIGLALLSIATATFVACGGGADKSTTPDNTGGGAATPTNHRLTLNGGAMLRHLARRVDAPAWFTVDAPPAPLGTRDVVLNSPGAGAGDFSTLRHLTLNSGAGVVAVPPGTYGSFTANGGSGFRIGVAGAVAPVAYN